MRARLNRSSLMLLLLTAWLAGSPARAADHRVKTATRSMAECVEILRRQDGGWCELTGASIADVFPRNLPDSLRMYTGPSSIIRAWNGAAFDGQRLKLYFHGGGHQDYGGNEVYEYDLGHARWTRLTDPAPLAPRTAEVRCPFPISGPPASHTYDGFIHSRRTDTLWLFPSFYACQGPTLGNQAEYWEFNPSESEPRNGIAPLGWRRYNGIPQQLLRQQYRTAEYPDGRMLVGDLSVDALLDPVTRDWIILGQQPSYGNGTSLYDRGRDVVWSLRAGGLFRNKQPFGPTRVSLRPARVAGAAGIALLSDGRLLFWGGGPATQVYDPQSERWTLHEFSGPAPGPLPQGIYSKWVRLDRFDVFAGYSDFRRGIWIYRHPTARPGIPLSAPSSDRAPRGSR